MENCILKVCFTDPKVLQFLNTSIEYYNYLYAQNTEQAIYFETIQDGILFIYKDFETFIKMAQHRRTAKKDQSRLYSLRYPAD